jgi:hypothetical protein
LLLAKLNPAQPNFYYRYAYSGATRTAFRGEGEQDSGLKPNIVRPIPERCSACPECFPQVAALDINAG